MVSQRCWQYLGCGPSAVGDWIWTRSFAGIAIDKWNRNFLDRHLSQCDMSITNHTWALTFDRTGLSVARSRRRTAWATARPTSHTHRTSASSEKLSCGPGFKFSLQISHADWRFPCFSSVSLDGFRNRIHVRPRLLFYPHPFLLIICWWFEYSNNPCYGKRKGQAGGLWFK
jgi:hypothetical protein